MVLFFAISHDPVVRNTFGIRSAGGNVRFLARIQKEMPTQLAININNVRLPPDATRASGISSAGRKIREKERKKFKLKESSDVVVKSRRQSDMAARSIQRIMALSMANQMR